MEIEAVLDTAVSKGDEVTLGVHSAALGLQDLEDGGTLDAEAQVALRSAFREARTRTSGSVGIRETTSRAGPAARGRDSATSPGS